MLTLQDVPSAFQLHGRSSQSLFEIYVNIIVSSKTLPLILTHQYVVIIPPAFQLHGHSSQSLFEIYVNVIVSSKTLPLKLTHQDVVNCTFYLNAT